MEIFLRTPKTPEEWEAYFLLRWQILRAKWNQPLGSEKDEFEKDAVHCAAYNENNVLLGVGRLHLTSTREAQVRYMAVKEEYNGKGIGSLILQELETKAKGRNIEIIILNARENAIPFYTKHDYSIEAPSHRLYGEIPHFKMRKLLKK